MIAILFKSGIPVNLTSVATNPRYDIEGFLFEFCFANFDGTHRYCYYFKSDFKRNDQKRTDLTDGFYREDMFIKYIQDKDGGLNIGIPSISEMIYKYKFDFTDFKNLITENDSITVSITDFDTPFDYFYNRCNYTFNFEYLPGTQSIKTYSEPILDELSIIDYKLKIPLGAIKTVVPVNDQSNTPGFYFFSKNLGEYINSLNISSIEKRKLKKITTLIVFKIREIIGNSNNNINGVIDGIIPRIMNASGFTDADLEVIANSTDTNINIDDYKTDPVNALKKLIFLIKKSWGYYYDPQSTLPNRNVLPPVFTPTSLYTDFEYYYLGLSSFYKTLYSEPIDNIPNYFKFEMILELLPANALSFISLGIKKSIIESFVKKKYLAEYEKRFLVRLILSIPFSESDAFLDYLSDCNDGIHTNYQAIYYVLGDARIERYHVASSIADEIPTRKQFVFSIYQLWKVSKYNFYYIPNGISPIYENINPNSYFVQNPQEFQTQNILEFTTTTDVTSENITKKSFEYSAIFINEKIRITKFETVDIYNNEYIDDGFGAPAISNVKVPKLPEKIGDFHMYHPISLIGMQPSQEIVLPQASFYPAFLFQYIKEFEDIKEFDASVNFAISITAEVALFYMTSGVSSLRYLNYLKNINRIFQATTDAALAGEQILIWHALEGATNALTLSGSILFSYNQYLIQISNNPDEIEKLQKLNNILFLLILSQATGSVIFRYKAVRSADDFLDTFTSSTIPTDIYNLLITLRGQKASNILLIRQKIAELELDSTNYVISKFDTFAADIKEAFWIDFKNLSINDWKVLNKTDNVTGIGGTAVDRWKYLYDRNIVDRKIISVVRSQSKVDIIVTHYNYPQLKGVLEPLDITKRWGFLDEMGNISSGNFDKFVQEPSLINKWLRYYDDLALREEFKALGENGMIEWCEHYGTLPQNLINELKSKPRTFKNWNNLDEADRLLLKDIPNEWIPSVYQYQDFCFIRKFCPVDIPSNSRIIEKPMANNYKQVYFRWNDGVYRWEIRAHTEIPNSPGVGNGNIWRVQREKISDGTFNSYSEHLCGNQWIQGHIYYDAIKAQQNNNATPQQIELLISSHFRAK
jgi:hypothetical protein